MSEAHISLPSAAASGIAAVVLGATGLELHQLSIGLMASLIALSGAERTSSGGWLSLLVASAICSASIGAMIGDRLGWGTIGTNGLIAVVGIALHIAFAYLKLRAVVIGDAGLRKAGVEIPPEDSGT